MLRNPFATSFSAPGRIGWLPADSNQSVETLICKFKMLGFRAAIRGPHGSGKSTLLTHLLAALSTLHEQPVTHHLIRSSKTPKQNSAALRLALRELKKHQVLGVDGFEQLNWRDRLLLYWTIKRKKLLVLVTTHGPSAWPNLIDLRCTEATACLIIKTLITKQVDAEQIPPQAKETYIRFSRHHCQPHLISAALQRHAGNLRELLLEWYDHFEDFRNKA